ncbi:hypothetical protein [Burkholderia ubonensis]|uniref:hypothetical protein n=1 Tax=Burkholderia ubonensis TaxID=101571 RepID=UPI001E3BA827|nr:hypothetical protein [Burkholderia ubonensis]
MSVAPCWCVIAKDALARLSIGIVHATPTVVAPDPPSGLLTLTFAKPKRPS